MKRRLDIEVKKPCEQSWNTFEKKGDVGFCDKCQQSVIDFTGKTDKDIFEYFSANRGKVCGKLSAKQLHSYYSTEEKFTFNKAAVLTAGLLTVTGIAESSIHNERTKTLTEQCSSEIKNKAHPIVSNSLLLDRFRIYGTVISEEDGSKLPGVNVYIKGTKEGVVTDVDGNFELLYQGNQGDEIILVFSFIGLQTTERQIFVTRDKSDLGKTKLSLDVVVLGEVCTVRSWTPRGIWWKIRGVFRRH
jgi:hypothetical protein